MSFLTTAWTIVPFFTWHFYVVLYVILEAFISILNIACCAPFEELLCVWRWSWWWWWCWGGAVAYSWLRLMVGKEAILTFRRDKALLSFRPTHDWVACRSFPLSIFSFTLKHNERILLFRVAAHFHWPPVAGGNAYQPMISKNKNKRHIGANHLRTD